MSIVFVGIGPDGIVFSGDGVATGMVTGDVLAHVSKLLLFPELNCIMGFTGMPRAGKLFALGSEGRYNDFDDLVMRVVADCKEMHTGILQSGDFHDYSKMCVALGGWSDQRQRFEAYRFMSYDKDSVVPDSGAVTTIPAWTLLPIDYIWASIACPPEDIERFQVWNSGDLVETGIRMVCAARQLSGRISPYDADGDTASMAGVGAYVQMALLNQDGVQSWIAHRWPEDVIGKPVDPTKGAAIPPWLEAKAVPDDEA